MFIGYDPLLFIAVHGTLDASHELLMSIERVKFTAELVYGLEKVFQHDLKADMWEVACDIHGRFVTTFLGPINWAISPPSTINVLLLSMAASKVEDTSL